MISGKTIKNVPIHINESLVKYRLYDGEKYYVIDKGYNKIEIDEPTYMRIKAPIRKRITPNEVQGIESGQ